jgi:hypothetical protein
MPSQWDQKPWWPWCIWRTKGNNHIWHQIDNSSRLLLTILPQWAFRFQNHSFGIPSTSIQIQKLQSPFLLQVLQARYHIFWSGLMWLMMAFKLKKTGCKAKTSQIGASPNLQFPR